MRGFKERKGWGEGAPQPDSGTVTPFTTERGPGTWPSTTPLEPPPLSRLREARRAPPAEPEPGMISEENLPPPVTPVGEAQMPGRALHDVQGRPIPGTEIPESPATESPVANPEAGFALVGRGSPSRGPRSALLPEEVAALPPESRAIYERIGSDTPDPLVREDVVDAVRKVYQGMQRFVAPAERLEASSAARGVKLPSLPSTAARLVSAVSEHQRMWLHDVGPVSETAGGVKHLGIPPLESITSPLSLLQFNNLKTLWVSRHALEVEAARPGHRSGLADPLNPDRAQAEATALQNAAAVVTSERDPAVLGALDQIAAFDRALNNHLVESGAASSDLVAKFDRLYPNWVSFQRELGRRDVLRAVKPGEPTPSPTAPFRRFKSGSEARILDPIESFVAPVKDRIAAADRNKVGVALVEALKADPETWGPHVQRVPLQAARASSSLVERVRKIAQESATELSEIEASQIADMISERSLNITDNILRVYQGDSLVGLKLSPELVNMVKALTPKQMTWAGAIAQLFVGPARAGITLTATFTGFNVFARDPFTALFQSKYGLKPWEALKGTFDLYREAYRQVKPQGKGKFVPPSQRILEFQAGGGGGFGKGEGSLAGVYSAPRTLHLLPGKLGEHFRRRTELYQLRRFGPQERAGPLGSALLTLRYPIEALRDLTRPGEQGPRFGEFRKAREAGASVAEASLRAQDVTVPFSMHGSDPTFRAYARATLFMMPAMQALGSVARAAKNPKNIALAGASYALGSLAIWALGKDDKAIRKLREQPFGNDYHYIRIPWAENTIARWPKVPVYGQVFATPVEELADYVYRSDPVNFSKMLEELFEKASFSVLPDVARFGYEQASGRDLGTNRPIEPQESLLPAYRAFSHTTQTAQSAARLGERVATKLKLHSPVSGPRIEHVIRRVFGTLGMQGLQYLDKGLDQVGVVDNSREPSPLPSDAPLSGGFFARPARGRADELREGATRSSEILSTYNSLLRHGRPGEAPAFLKQNLAEWRVAPLYLAGVAQLNAFQSTLAAIENSRMEPNRKSAAMLQQRELMSSAADRWLRVIRGLTNSR